MSDWKMRRFWTSAGVRQAEDGFRIELDGRPVRTPAKLVLAAPTAQLAQAIAAEWDAQVEDVKPQSMPMTRSANAAIDKVASQFREVADMLAAYGDSDLTCYRAEGPEELVAKQAQKWDPLLDWAAEKFNARLIPVQGVIHHPQHQAALQSLAQPLYEMSAFELTAMHDLISLSGSLILGLAVSEGQLDPKPAWDLSRIDEDWQIAQWGEDDEATAQAALKYSAFVHADSFLKLARS